MKKKAVQAPTSLQSSEKCVLYLKQEGTEIYPEEEGNTSLDTKRCTIFRELPAECCPENQKRRKDLENQ